jgi:hypothetical protein
MLSDHHTKKVELKNKRSRRKYSNNWRLNKMTLKDQWILEEIRNQIKMLPEFNENENTSY